MVSSRPTHFILAGVLAVFAALSAAAQPGRVPTLSKTLFDQAVDEYNKGKYDAAIADFTKYLSLMPNDPSGWFNRGIAYQQKADAAPSRQDYEKAAADLSQAIKLDAKQSAYWLSRGQVHARLMTVDFERYRKAAVDDLTQALRLSPTLAPAWRERGQVYEQINDQNKALADLNRAIELDSKDAIAYYTRGKVQGSKNNYTAARSDLETALRLFPNYQAAKAYLDYINEQARKIPVAKPAGTTPQPANAGGSAAINNVQDGVKRTEDAERAGNYALAAASATRTLALIPMRAEYETQDDLMTSVYLSLLRTRARANAALGKYADSDADYESLGAAAIKNMHRFDQAANAALAKDKSAGGIIMAGVESFKAVLACKTGFDGGNEWIDAVKRTRPNDTAAGVTAGISMIGVRDACSVAYIIYGRNQSSNALIDRANRAKHLNDAVESFTEAIRIAPRDARPYTERANVYRELGRTDLAAADEQKARQLQAGN